jgi:hypothetical protein
MSRQPWENIEIRETPEGPEIVFDNGTSGWVIPVTEADLGKLEYVVVHHRQAQATALRERQGR